MNYFKDVKHNPKLDKFYFCSKCGEKNDPFSYKQIHEFEEMCKTNVCRNCKTTANKKELFIEKSQTKHDQE